MPTGKLNGYEPNEHSIQGRLTLSNPGNFWKRLWRWCRPGVGDWS